MFFLPKKSQQLSCFKAKSVMNQEKTDIEMLLQNSHFRPVQPNH